MNMAAHFSYRSDVEAALEAGKPLVALESTVITHGLPYPQNVETALMMETAVREGGAIPATMGIIGGKIIVGLTAEQMEYLGLQAGKDTVRKCSRRDLPLVLAQGGDGSTTVAGTMILAHLAGIELFATGGIGGVHRGHPFDISADLSELGRTPVTVVCAGPKSILDVGRTLEALETRGVPVVGWGSDVVAGFYSQSSGHAAPLRVDDATGAARLIDNQRRLGLDTGVLITVPLPAHIALPADEVDAAVAQAEADAEAAGIHGPASTPFVLGRVAEITKGRSVRANLEIIRRDAAVAGRIAIALAAIRS